MIVVCKRGTKRLIKGHRYEVTSLFNSGTGNPWRNGKIVIKDVGRFSVNSFTDTNGKEIAKVDYQATIVRPTRYTFEDCSKGDILVCNSDRYKTFVKGGMYKIEELTTVNSVVNIKYNNTTRNVTTNYVKFVGIKRKMKFNSWSFRRLNSDEAREISLNHILNNEDTNIIIESVKRNIELVDDKDDVLLKILAKSILDPYRHNLSVIEWGCDKHGDKLSLESSDFDPYLNMTLADILKKID
jgi:hypothetical protein